MKVVYLNVNDEQRPAVMDIEDELKEFYKLCQCQYVEIIRRRIGRKCYTVICDEEGLFVESPKLSAIDDRGNPQLVGNLIICNDGEDGELAGLSDDDAAYITRHVRYMRTHKHPDGYFMLTQCGY